MDVNDNSPRFSSVSYSSSVAENSAVGATVLLLSATDVDAGPNGQVSNGLTDRVDVWVLRVGWTREDLKCHRRRQYVGQMRNLCI